MQRVADSREIVDRFFILAGYHFLEAGYVRIVLIDEVKHLLFHVRVIFVMKDIKLFNIPAHHPNIAGTFC